MKPFLNQEINLKIQRLGINGEGIGYWNGYTLFVEGVLPGETIKARITELRKNFGRAVLKQLQIASSHRTIPPCPLFGTCGGCQLMHLSYEQQLENKRQRIVDALQRIGKILDIEVSPCIPSPLPLGYRNKIQLPLAPARAPETSLRIGLYAQNSHDLVEIEQCSIHCPLGEKVFKQIRKILQASSLPAYDRQTGKGLLRHVLIKTAIHTSQALVILVTGDAGPSTLYTFAAQIMEALPEIKGVVQNIHSASSNVILGKDFHTLAGKGFIEEELCGLRFKVSPASFFQVNPLQAEKLYAQTLEATALTPKDVVLDAYCGVGTLSLIAAQCAKRVIGIECIAAAVDNAWENAHSNQITNAEFICTLAEEYTPDEQIDVVFLNPPRKGCAPSFLKKLSALHPSRIAYISCDPATLARDLACLREHGYQIATIQPFDMFPQTAHVECLVSLKRSLI